MLEAGHREREAGVKEVARLRSELAQEVMTMQQVHNAQRSRPGSIAGRNVQWAPGGGGRSVFMDRDGSVFGHVLAYLREGVVATTTEA